jgi:hypothetical protein
VRKSPSPLIKKFGGIADKEVMNILAGLIFMIGVLMTDGLNGIAHAEYRMFTLKITHQKTQDFRLVDSTLDPLQYPFYYPVQKDEVVQYTETWRCYGRTGDEQPPCPNPKTIPKTAPNPATDPAPSANP